MPKGEDYFIDVVQPASSPKMKDSTVKKRYLPRMKQLIEWIIVGGAFILKKIDEEYKVMKSPPYQHDRGGVSVHQVLRFIHVDLVEFKKKK
ncbi:hypothetical protein [Caldalkalibacillus mannanilyticus]|uniref:hypothetical protein n=1 Tax=Caldalkalibacillus mannanilyticus TaxID=1418 RepID=UPI00046AE6C7|nr:hypothetical protein [Caldalkalibacillus mannanilyticus]